MKKVLYGKEAKINNNATSPNRIVYASPPEGGSSCEKPQSAQVPLCGFVSATVWQPCKTFGFAYSGCQTVIYNQNVICNTLKMINYILTKYYK